MSTFFVSATARLHAANGLRSGAELAAAGSAELLTPAGPIAARVRAAGERSMLELQLADGSTAIVGHGQLLRTVPSGPLAEDEAATAHEGMAPARLSLATALPTDGTAANALTLAWMAGLFLGNGYSGIERRADRERPHAAGVHVWELRLYEPAVIERFEDALRAQHLPCARENIAGGRLFQGNLAEWTMFWRSLELWGDDNRRQVPGWVFISPRPVIAAFLRGLHEAGAAEGWFVATDEPMLAADAQLLLRVCGVVARRGEMPGASRPHGLAVADPLSAAAAAALEAETGMVSGLLVEAAWATSGETVIIETEATEIAVDGLRLVA